MLIKKKNGLLILNYSGDYEDNPIRELIFFKT